MSFDENCRAASVSRFTIVPTGAVCDQRLSHVQLRVLLAIGAHTSRDRAAFPKQRTLADMLGITRETVNRAIKDLRQYGYVSQAHQAREDGGQRENLYWVNLDPPCDSTITPPVTSDDHTPCDHTESQLRTANKNNKAVSDDTVGGSADLLGDPPCKPSEPSELDIAFEAYQKLAKRLNAERGSIVWPVVRQFTDKRKRRLQARLKENGLAQWGVVLRNASRSSFCTGLRGDWSADFDFLTSPDGFLKTMEGKYNDRFDKNGAPAGGAFVHASSPDAFERLAAKISGSAAGQDAGQHDEPAGAGGYLIEAEATRRAG